MAATRNEWYVYILRCADGSLYTGVSTDVNRRVETHNKGKGAKYTRSRIPVSIVAIWGPFSKSLSHSAENRIKSLSRKQKDKILEQTDVLSYLDRVVERK
jgi:putative endonuclease